MPLSLDSWVLREVNYLLFHVNSEVGRTDNLGLERINDNQHSGKYFMIPNYIWLIIPMNTQHDLKRQGFKASTIIFILLRHGEVK